MKAKFQTLLCVLLVALFILAAGCSSHTMQLTSADQGKQVAVNAGGKLEISLEGNPTTGYIWEAANLDTSFLKQVGAVNFKSSNPNLVGSGGQQTLTFVALKPGTTVLTLVYHRPWEQGVAPLQTYQVFVTIK